MVKQMLDTEDQANNVLQSDVELKSKKKKKKHKNKDTLINGSEGTEIAFDQMDTDSQIIEESLKAETHHSKTKKKKKSKEVCSNGNENAVNDNTEGSLTCPSAQSIGITVGDKAEISVPKKKRKKMKKEKLREEEKLNNNEGCIEDKNVQENANIKKKKSKKHALEAKQTVDDVVLNKDDKMELNMNNNDTNESVEGGELTNKHKKKKRKHRKDLDETNQTQSSNGSQDNGLEVKALKRKVDEVNSVEEMIEPKKKHKKKKRSKKDQSIDIKQEEAENEEKKHENFDSHNNFKNGPPVEEKANENCTVGQWQTADFGDKERQNKFMKLLGGQKPGANKNQLQAKFKLNAGKSNENVKHDSSGVPMPNMAMNKTQERMYKIALENQFEKAQDFNQNRGVGLGFQTSNKGSKKFHIDVLKSKSVKFDD